jgi:AcrR family transcriptional regulator
MPSARSEARERLLEVAGRLFYAEGIHSVGIDRVLADAEVAKATLYAHFSGKNELVAAYLDGQSRAWLSDVETLAAARPQGSVAAVLTPFDVLRQRVTRPAYRGCPFINAAAEFPEPGPVAQQVESHRRRVKALFAQLLRQAGADPSLVTPLVLLYDGAVSAAHLDRTPESADVARALAEDLLTRRVQPRQGRTA